MRLTNATIFPAAWTSGFARDGRELLVVMAKATYGIPPPGADEPELFHESVELVQADHFTGEPGTTAIDQATDYVIGRPGCDVLLFGSAYAPVERLATRVIVGLQVGALRKVFDVVGPRVWHSPLGMISRASAPQPFDRLPIGYDFAFGGTDRTEEDQGRTDSNLANPVGRGYWPRCRDIDGLPLPHTEASDEPVTDPRSSYRPMSFGAIGRNWLPRLRYAGTYDEAWRRSRAPLWPDDFDERYFQAAPPDQVLPELCGGEEVCLVNLTPDGRRQFRLPTTTLPMLLIPHRGADRSLDVRIDTLVIEPDAHRFTMTWRATVPMARSVFDAREVVVGDMPRSWHRARGRGEKPWYPSLRELVAAHRPTRTPP